MATLHASLSTFHTPNSGIIPPGGGHIHYFDFCHFHISFSFFFQNILITDKIFFKLWSHLVEVIFIISIIIIIILYSLSSRLVEIIFIILIFCHFHFSFSFFCQNILVSDYIFFKLWSCMVEVILIISIIMRRCILIIMVRISVIIKIIKIISTNRILIRMMVPGKKLLQSLNNDIKAQQ